MQSVHTFHDRMKINVLDTTAINPVFIDSLIVVRLFTVDILRFTSNSCRYATIVSRVKISQKIEKSNYPFFISYKINVSGMFSPNPAKSRSSLFLHVCRVQLKGRRHCKITKNQFLLSYFLKDGSSFTKFDRLRDDKVSDDLSFLNVRINAKKKLLNVCQSQAKHVAIEKLICIHSKWNKLQFSKK